MLKLISSIVAVTTFIIASLNSFIAIPKTNAASYRTTYQIYGDLNSDNKIDIYDVISMRKAVIKGEYDKNLDFNCDDAVDTKDLDLLNDYVLGNNTFFDIYLNDDADEDQVCDIYEAVVYKSDPDSKDTDGDTLSDYEEVVYSNTSPTNKYTRGLSVTDADDDPDEDQLSNKEEMARKTEPLIADTDWDNLSDYDEINVYFTDPLIADTDGDGISDGSEIKLKLNPNKAATNGVSDGEYVIKQTIDADSSVLSSVNTGISPYQLSIDIKTNGDAEKALTVGKSTYSDVIANDAMLGDSIDIDLPDTSVLEEMVLRFNIDELRTYNTLNKFSSIGEFKGIKRLNIFRYDKEDGTLLPIDTEYDADNDQIYAEANETGTYCIMDMEIWLDSLGAEMADETNKYYSNGRNPAPPQIKNNTAEYVPTYTINPIDIKILLQTAGTDVEAFNKQKKIIAEFCDYLYSKYPENVNIEIYSYGEDSGKVIPYYKRKAIVNHLKTTFLYTENDWYNEALDEIEYTVTDDCCGIAFAFSCVKDELANVYQDKPNEYIYSFRNGNTLDNSDNLYCSYYGLLDFAEKLHSHYIKGDYRLSDHRWARFSEIGIPEWKYMIVHRDIEPYEDPSNINIIKGRIENNEDLYLDTYDASLDDFIEHFERTLYREPVYNINLSTSGKKIILDGELSPYNNIDTDGDGLTDWEEVDTSKLKINSDGSIEYPVLDISEIVRTLKRFKEDGEYATLLDSLNKIIYLPIRSDPTKADSDGDGYTDIVEYRRGTDPLSVDFIIEKTFYEYLISDSPFEANTYREKYYNNSVESGSVFLGKTLCAGKPFSIDLYKSAIVDFLDYAYDKQETEYRLEKLINIEEATFKAFIDELDACNTALDISGIAKADLKKDTDLYKKLREQLQNIEKWRSGSVYSPNFGTVEEFYKFIDEYNEMYQKTADEIEELKKTIKTKKLQSKRVDKFLKRAGIALGAIDVSVSFSKTLEGYMAFSDCIERFELGMEILDLLQDPAFSSDDTMRRAAGVLKSYALAAENDVSFALKEALKAGGMELGNIFIHYVAGEVKYTTWLEVLISAGDIIFNWGDVSENAEILVAKSFIPDAIAISFQSGIKFDSKYNFAFASGSLAQQKAKYLLALIMSRRDAESQCVTYYEASPWFMELTKSADITHAKNNVSTLDNYLDEYFIKCKPLLF